MSTKNDINSSVPFLYIGQTIRGSIPRNITDVTVDPTIKVIKFAAFQGCNELRNVELCDGVQTIDDNAFDATSITTIVIPSTVVHIGSQAFMDCGYLTNVQLYEGLERIESGAFQFCPSLEEINIPNTVKILEGNTFWNCTGLKKVQLNEGLIEIQCFAFEGCTSLRTITIPASVNFISNMAFFACISLVRIEYCQAIQQFVSMVPLLWWNGGLSMSCVMTYSFLRKNNIVVRLGRIKKPTWQINIHVMLMHIPEKLKEKKDNYYNQLDSDNSESKLFLIEIDEYFDSIQSLLSNYEQVQEAITALEQVIMSVTDDSCGFSMCAIIVPNVLPFVIHDV